MSNINYSVLERIPMLTTMESNVFTFLVRYQDEDGLVIGVHYKDVMDEVGFKSRQTFYNALHSLRKKGFISYTQNATGDYDVTVLDNEGYTKQEQHDYVNMNRNIFYDNAYYKMKSGEKYLLMLLMRATAKQKGRYVRNVKGFLGDMMEKLKVTRRVVFSYLRTIKKYFSIKIDHGLFVITFQSGEWSKDLKRGVRPERRTLTTQPEQKNWHIAHTELRRRKVKACKKEDEAEIGRLFFVQYRKDIEKQGYTNPLYFLRTFLNSFLFEYPEQFNIKFLHKQLRVVLDLEEQ